MVGPVGGPLSGGLTGPAAYGENPPLPMLDFPEGSLFRDVRHWQAWLDATGHASKTCRQYRRTLMNFVADTLLDPRTITERELVEHLGELPPNGSARGALLRAFKSFFSFYDDGSDPTRRLPIRKPKLGPAPFLTRAQMARLVEAAAMHPGDGPRRAWAILFAYTTGGRVESLCAVRPSDVRGGRVYFWKVKNDDPYSVPLSAIGQQATEALASLGGPTLVGVGPNQFWSWVSTAARRAGMHVWPHLLRHSFATHLRQSGADPTLVARLLNHKDLSQITRYQGVEQEEEAHAVARAFG